MKEDATTYHMLREKTISQSLRYIPDFAEILHSILQERIWPSDDYAEYLSEHEALILDVFASDYGQRAKMLLAVEDGKYHNLRALTKGMESFFRIYYHTKEAGVALPDSHLYSFLAYYLAAKSGIRKGGELVLEFTESDLSQFYPGFSQDALTNIEREWIKTGIWDTNLFLDEIGVRSEAGQTDKNN